jgi:hypothetical protein
MAQKNETGAHVLVMHHAGKDERRGLRGHSSLKAAMEIHADLSAISRSLMMSWTAPTTGVAVCQNAAAPELRWTISFAKTGLIDNVQVSRPTCLVSVQNYPNSCW